MSKLTLARVTANRANARHSTGPRTAAGKARVATNALKHGFRTDRILLPGELPEDFHAFRQGFHHDLAPRGPVETALVDRLVTVAWRVARVPWVEAGLWRGHLYEGRPERGMAYLAALHTAPAPARRAVGEDLRQAHARVNDVGRAFERAEAAAGTVTTLARYETRLDRSVARLLVQLEALQRRRGRPGSANVPKQTHRARR